MDDASIDDSSLYTSGMHSRGGRTIHSVTTHNTRMTHQTTLSEQIRRVKGVTPTSRTGPTKRRNGDDGWSVSGPGGAGDDVSTLSGLQSVDSYYRSFAMPAPPPRQIPRFEGGPLSQPQPQPQPRKRRPPTTPPLTPIQSTPTSSVAAPSTPRSPNASCNTSLGSASWEAHNEYRTPPPPPAGRGDRDPNGGDPDHHRHYRHPTGGRGEGIRGVPQDKVDKSSRTSTTNPTTTPTAAPVRTAPPSEKSKPSRSVTPPPTQTSDVILPRDDCRDTDSLLSSPLLSPSSSARAVVPYTYADDMHALTHTPTTTTPTIAQTPLSLSVSLQHRPIMEEDGHDSDSDWTPHIRNKDAKGHVIPTTPKLLFLNTNDRDDASDDDSDDDDDSDEDTNKDDNHKDEDTIYGDDYTTHGGDYKMCQKINKNEYNGNDDDDNYYNNINNSRDEESTLDLTLGSKINMSDAELMDGRNASPGALRLTEEGLVEHTEKQQRYYDTNNITGSTTPLSHSVLVGYDIWKKQQAERKYHRDKLQQRDDQLEAQIAAWTQARDEAEQSERKVLPGVRTEPLSSAFDKMTVTGTKSRQIPVHGTKPRLTAPRVKEEGVDAVSLAPLEMMDAHILDHTPSSSKKSPSQPTVRLRPFGLRPRKMKKKVTAEELLERERARQREAQVKHEEDEKQEFERIEQMRQAYLVKQREIEALARTERLLNPVLEDTPLEMEDIEEEDLVPSVKEFSPSVNECSNTSQGKDTVSVQSNYSVSTFTLHTKASSDPCALCGTGDRTHIAMPCMHYCFCEDCVETLQEQRVTVCPVCNANRVSFTKVFF